MKKIIFLTVIFSLVFATLSVVNASMLIPSSDMAKEKAQAPEKSPVINLTETGEWELERVDFIHYAKPDHPVKTDKPTRPPKTETCFKLLGVKWNSLPVDYVINPLNQDGLNFDFVFSAIASSAEIWDVNTSAELFNDSFSVDITKHYGSQDFINAIDFGSLSDNNIIAVTSIWYTRRGKQIVEFDIRFNDYYTWGDATATSGVMDLANIAVHELGHGVGMADIYSETCSEVTMYGYSGYNETKKRTLEFADIQGLQKMYDLQ